MSGPCVSDTSSVALTQDPVTGALLADVKISGDAGQGIEDHADGLWLPRRRRTTSFPSTPFDEQEIAYLADTDTLWPLMFNAATGHWDAAGATEVFAGVAVETTRTANSFAGADNAGPSVHVPRTGLYLAGLGGTMYGESSGLAVMSFKIGGAAALDVNAVQHNDSGKASVSRIQKLNLTGGIDLFCHYRGDGANVAHFENRFIWLKPIWLQG
jgi:hypothetical protein